MFFAISYAHGMDKYPLLRQKFKTLSEAQRWEYRKQLEEWRASPEHAQESRVDQVQLGKILCEDIEKEKIQRNVYEQKNK
jgi:hypothetical protein